jgi:hypothetical protein
MGGAQTLCAASIARVVRRPGVPPGRNSGRVRCKELLQHTQMDVDCGFCYGRMVGGSVRDLASSMPLRNNVPRSRLALVACAAVLASALGCGARTSILDESLPESAASGGSGPHEAGDDGGPSGCFRLDPGNSCAWFATDLSEDPDACQTDGYEVGSCPSSGLIGCCIEGVPGQPVTNAACAYEPKPGLSSASCGQGTFYWQDAAP